MDPFTAALLGGGANLLGGLLGAGKADEQRRAAEAAHMAAMQQIAGLQAPTLEDLTFQLTPEMMPEFEGGYDPAMEEAIAVDPSAMEEVLAQTDPRLKELQMQNLERIAGVAEAGGLTEADRAALEQIRRQTAGQEQARQEAVLQEMARRGQAGSGAELIARLKGAQAAADRAGAMGLDVAQMAQAREDRAMRDAMTGAGQTRRQEFGELSDVAQARDVVNRFKAQLRSGEQQRNVGAQNLAQREAAADRQRLAEKQAELLRQQEAAKIGAKETKYGYDRDKARDLARLHSGAAGRKEERAGQEAQLGAGVGSSIGQMITGLWGK